MPKKSPQVLYRMLGKGRQNLTESPPLYIAFDYRLESANPTAAYNAGHRDICFSWRQNDTAAARAHLTTARNLGMRIWITIEPWVRTLYTDSNVKSGWASDDALWDLAEAGNYWLRDDLGAITNPVPEWWDSFQNRTRGLDFSNPTFAHQWADWINSRWHDIAGVYHDYGFPHDGGLSWVNGYGDVLEATWLTWDDGYRAAFDRERATYPSRALMLGEYGSSASLNAYIAPRSTSVIIEGAGPLQGNLFSYQKAWQIAREGMAAGLRPLIWYLDTNAQARRLLACMAVATNGYFGRRVDTDGYLTTPELQTLTIGRITDISALPTSNTWAVQGTKGFIVINVNAISSVNYRGYSVGANDGLMVQEYGPNGGTLNPPQTNAGV